MRQTARALAFGRIGFGLAAVLAPRLVAGAWVGRDGARSGATVLTRALGVRDALLGMMALHTLDRPEVAQRWQYSLAVCDAVDGVSTLAVRRALPGPAVAGAAAIAFGTAATEVAIARSLEAAAAPGSPAPSA